GHEVVAGGRRFVLHLAEPIAVTWEGGSAPVDIHHATLRFAVTRDEEHVELTVISELRRIELGARAHFYLLLTLARARLAEAQTGSDAGDHGWLYQDDLAQMLGIDLKH